VKAVGAMGKRRREVHIYLDNSAWRHLFHRDKQFKVTEESLKTLKNSRYKPVLSEENYREFGKSLISQNKDAREESKSVLRFMISQAWPRVFSEGDILNCDLEKILHISKNNYFMEKRRAWKLRNAFLRPYNYLSNINEMVKNSEIRKKGFTNSISSLITKALNTRGNLISEGGLGDLDEDDFRRLFAAFCRSQTTKMFVEKRLRAIGIRRSTRDVAYFFAHIEKSKVFGAFLKHLCGFILHRLKTGRIRIDPNDVLDRRHYMMAGFCEYFITDDNTLLTILSNIPDDYQHVKVMSLPEFIEGQLMPEVR
jgi:hypothetical protein